MSLSDYIGRIVDHVEALPSNWRSRQGVVHSVNAHMMRQEHEPKSEAIAEFWQTACESDAWEEKRPKLTKKPVTRCLCLGSMETPE